jgi:hypothetical protein
MPAPPTGPDTTRHLRGIARDNAVATKVVCPASSVKQNPGGTWTATCTVTDSDGKTYTGYGNIAGTEVTFEPVSVSGG